MNPLPQRMAQQGVALIIALVLLVVITLMGLAGMQNTTLQERMSGNMYDRSLAMQAAEAALRAAEAAISANANVGIDCTDEGANLCTTIPDDTFTGTGGSWTAVGAAYVVNEGSSIGSAQYHIQIVNDAAIADELGETSSANNKQYGSGAGAPTERFYRVTARSHDPTVANSDTRSIVVLQTTVRRAI